MECYVKYLDCKNNFKETIKDFKTYKEAWDWVRGNFDNPNLDYIYYY